MFFDTHAHLDDDAFDSDRDEIIASLKDFGVTRVLNASSDMPSSERTISLCDKYDFIYGAIGVHPHDAENMKDMDSKGIVLNSAFAISAAFTFAGHLAFTLAFDSNYIFPVIIGKLVAGITSLFVATIIYKRVFKTKDNA